MLFDVDGMSAVQTAAGAAFVCVVLWLDWLRDASISISLSLPSFAQGPSTDCGEGQDVVSSPELVEIPSDDEPTLNAVGNKE